ncbi:hypothetical protein BACI71_110127 [Bacillus mycoides]|uniref:Uncharacterized protein n=1 Tax=Bacillus mycoides TaxID=1405 RepID=A0A653PI28_BACMY|nr:hypothetical protein BACI71_110127 [Bacillus mycoides]
MLTILFYMYMCEQKRKSYEKSYINENVEGRKHIQYRYL